MGDSIFMLIDGVEHSYTLDKAVHAAFFKLMKYTPHKALSFIKERCRTYNGITR